MSLARYALLRQSPMTSRSKGVGLIVPALGLSQIIGYGTLYYSFGVLAPLMAADFACPVEWIYGALSFSLLLGGLVAPLSGRLADRHGAGAVMSWGSLAASLALVLCALAPERITFVVGLAAMEVASGFVLYATAFVALAQASASGAQKNITYLTLIAGFASTIFWPLTGWLNLHLSWRDIYLVYALINLLFALPVHLWLARTGRRRHALQSTSSRSHQPPLLHGSRVRFAMMALLVGFAFLGFVASAVTVHMLPMLGALGLGGSATLVTTLFGPSQVLSRLVNMQFGRGLPQPALAFLAAGALPLALLVLALTAPWAPGAAVFAVLFGFGNGLSSIVSGTLPLMLFGAQGYGARLGWISSARLIASAAAPFLFAVLAALSSVQTALWVVVGVGIAAAGTFGAIALLIRQPQPSAPLQTQDARAREDAHMEPSR